VSTMRRSSVGSAVMILFLGACSQAPQQQQTQEPAPASGAAAPTSSEPASSASTAASQARPAAAPSTDLSASPGGGNPVVELYTNKGLITVELDAEKAPVSTKNFVQYVTSGFYDGTVFHRVIPNFMIQGGGMTPDLTEKPTRDPIVNEGQNGLKNVRGTIAMARTDDLNSATAQFFVNLVDNAALDYPHNGGYAVFGKVTSGMDVVDAIAKVPTGTRGMYDDVPTEVVTIEKAKLKE
jgi:cyclophilin family peptidyl-prolyl cis-trans isomerase